MGSRGGLAGATGGGQDVSSAIELLFRRRIFHRHEIKLVKADPLGFRSRSCRFIATVNRVETVKKLKRTFKELGGLGPTVQVRQSNENVQSVAESDVILLW